MNDLFSTSSFKKYADAPQTAGGDMEAGGETVANLDKFFQDVEAVKEDIQGFEALYKRLQATNEETKTAHEARAVKALRSRMDGDVEKVLKRAKAVKTKLEALDRDNANSRKVPGCGPGSSTDRTRSSVVSGLGKKLKETMDEFQGLRTRMAAEYKETVARRYHMVTGEHAEDSTIESLISSGESESFMQKAIQDQGRGQVMDTISEIQERHDAVKDIERSLMDLHQVFLDMAALVEAQGAQINDIESHVAHASSFVRRGTVELEQAHEIQKDTRKWMCFAVLGGIALVVVLITPVLINLHILTLR
ncbi:hypothetical protein QYE76_034811 [Lolium multiflorum]|uniref:t-SNARE coiled-coil homology domain-containing protein n=1 Tax=Lolium multiflorum TaxID=4521 RepID=A0AAD8QY21_LOLMU|nr:syntaxin-125-like [Lolium rigidum]XP_051198373.1 syntaxin-125-like [Lolium perenne]KAK1611138.1 hypothetical protein QYE76_034811 [Lolium multiflorum]